MKQEERAVTISLPGEPGDLEGIFVAGRSPATGGCVIAPPHPLYGGSMDSPVVAELAHACTRAGLASLRFNWRGAGASAGTPTGDARAADADFAAALAHQAETVSGELVGCGYSFGACSAVRACQRVARCRRLVLVAPPPAILDGTSLRRFEGRVLVMVGENDSFAPVASLREMLAGIPETTLHVIPQADHFFLVGLGELGRVAREWLET